jgi:2,5-diamino-6-(ribosylamino)-4(3H)-pyrimidinone 5'-phosphate reductase
MLMSVDGKISTGATDEMDVDQDFPQITGLREGLYQYYEIEQTTDLWSFNTGRVQAKMGVNERDMPDKTPVSFVLLDNHHLNEQGVRYFCTRSKQFVLITSNPDHPAFRMKEDNLGILLQKELSLESALEELYERYGCKRLTIQSGGTMNGLFLRSRLIDCADIVVAPVLIGGKDTSSLIDGPSITSREELGQLGVMKLLGCEPLEDSYVRLKYEITYAGE